jgi:integrase
MPRIAKRLTEHEVSELRQPGCHAVGGVPGLLLQVTKNGARSWILRMTIDGKRREIGLGPYPTVDLERAALLAAEKRSNRPLCTFVRGTEASRANEQTVYPSIENDHPATLDGRVQLTFQEAAQRYFDEHDCKWKNEKHAQQARSIVTRFAYPVIGQVAVRDITLEQILTILRPGWNVTPETFRRLRGRIESILDWGADLGYRSGENPARWKGNLEKHLHRHENQDETAHAHVPPERMPDLMKALHQKRGMSDLCVSFIALTLCKAHHARFATKEELNFYNKTWMIPVDRNMQSAIPFTVFLSNEAIGILRKAAQNTQAISSPYVFPTQGGAPLSDALSAVFKRLRIKATADGFRSTFKEWCEKDNRCSEAVRTKALGLKPRNRESTTAPERLEADVRKLLAEWGAYCMSKISGTSDRITDEGPESSGDVESERRHTE